MSRKIEMTSILCIVFLFLPSVSPAQSAPKQSMLIPVSLEVIGVEPFLTVGESVHRFSLPDHPSGLVLTRASRGGLKLLVGHDIADSRRRPATSEWSLKPYWDKQGMLMLIATDGRSAIRSIKYLSGMSGAKDGYYLSASGTGTDDAMGEYEAVLSRRDGFVIVNDSRKALGFKIDDSIEVDSVLPVNVRNAVSAFLISGKERGNDNSHLYLWVCKGGGSTKTEEQLSGGKLYVMQVTGMKTEAGLSKKDLEVSFTFVKTQAVGTTFANLSGLCKDKNDKKGFYMVSEGSESRLSDGTWINHNGRVYSLSFNNSGSPEAGGTLKVVLGGTEGILGPACVTSGSNGVLMIGESPRFPLPGRNTSIWEYNVKSENLQRVLEVRPPAGGNEEKGEWRITALLNISQETRPGWYVCSLTSGSFTRGKDVEKGQLVAFGIR